jgi:hypothetical protein
MRPRLAAPFVRSALTLVELLLALGLIVIVSAMMFLFYETSLRSRDQGLQIMSDDQLARTIANMIAEEIRSANGFVPSLGPGLSGDDHTLSLQTVAIPDKSLFLHRSIKDGLPPAECDIRTVQYYLAYDPDKTDYDYSDGTKAAAPLGLVRREIRTLNQVAQSEAQPLTVDLDLVAKEIKYIRLRYFDGVDWVDKWDIGKDAAGAMGNSLPQAVEVTVGYNELPPKDPNEIELDQEKTRESELTPSIPEPYDPRTFTVVVRLPQADPFLGSRVMRAQRYSSMGSSSSGGGE